MNFLPALSTRGFRWSWDVLVRILADALMINVAIISGLGIRFLTIVMGQNGEEIVPLGLHWHYVNVYLSTGWLVTTICLIIFTLSGFYTYGRAYKGRYKLLVIFQAVSLGYLVSGFSLYVLMGSGVQLALGISGMEIPRFAFLLAWGFTCVLTAGSRLWSIIWRRVIHRESKRLVLPDQRNQPRNILVIGGAGYIGSALLRHLLDGGYRVRLLDTLLYGKEPIAELLDHPRLEIVNGDFRQVDRVVEATQDMDTVIHLGAIVGDPACALDEKLTLEVNLIATRMIAEVAKSMGINRFIFASTCSVYGVGEEILDEHSRLNPVSLYARTKLASEKMLSHLASDDFSPVNLRFGTIYGLSGRVRFDLVVNLLTAQALMDQRITIFGGSQWRPFVHVEDAARAILKVVEAPLSLVHNEVFNVGSNGQNYQIKTIGEMIHQMVPAAELINKGDDTDKRDYRVNFDKISQLGYVPSWTVERGISQVMEAFQSGRVQNYEDSIYSNVKFMSGEGVSQLMINSQDWMRRYLQDALELHQAQKLSPG